MKLPNCINRFLVRTTFSHSRLLLPVLLLMIISFGPELQAQQLVAENYKIDIQKHEVPCSGKPFTMMKHSLVGNYGSAPQITLKPDRNPANKNGYCIAWLERNTKQIVISVFSANHQLLKEIKPEYIGETSFLGGFDVLPDQRYAVGYTKDNAHGDRDFEYWVTVLEESGDSVFNRRSYGNRPSDEVNSHGGPMDASTARMDYADTSKELFFYMGHTKLWPDGLRHQGGYFAKMDMEGNEERINEWFVSHNFDQRMKVRDGNVYAMYHGDAYPRALGVGIHGINKKRGFFSRGLKKEDVFEIDGATGNNFTGCKIGDVLPFENETFGTIFTTRQNKKSWTVGYVPVEWKKEKHDAGKVTWLNGKKGHHCMLPMAGIRTPGRNLIAFQNYENTGSNYVKYDIPTTTSFYEVSNTGNILTDRMDFDDILLTVRHDMVNLPNGNLLWATARETSKDSGTWVFDVYEIDQLKNNQLLYNSYSEETYDKLMFDTQNGGFLVRASTLKKNKKWMTVIGERLARQGKQVELYGRPEKGSFKFTDCMINYEPFKFLTVSKPNEKSFLKIRDEVRKSGKNIVIHFKKSCDFETFKNELSKLFDKAKESRTVIFVDPDQLIRIDLPYVK